MGGVVQALRELGVGQAWQNVMASRAKGVVYTNTTSKPIFVAVNMSIAAYANAQLYVDGVAVADLGYYASIWATLHGVVPPGSTYKVDGAGGVSTVSFWLELR